MLDEADEDTATSRKARGAFFTPDAICQFMAAWAIRSGSDRVLEPSCGEAAFLIAAGDRLRQLSGGGDADRLHTFTQLHAVELHEASALSAASLSAARAIGSTIHVGDFFDYDADGTFDAVIGNPPYVRYQDFTGASRTKAKEAALRQGINLSGLASSWAPFVLHAASVLRDTGRLALVLPAELLTVRYAGPVRAWLMDRFASLRLVMFEERVFPGVSEEVVLLLAEGRGPTDRFTVHPLRDLDDLAKVDERAAQWQPPSAADKWSPALLPPDAGAIYRRLLNDGTFVPLDHWGTTYLGAVTGNNKFFTLTPQGAAKAGLRERDLIRISPPGSRHLRGVTFTEAAWREMANAGRPVYLFYPAAKPSAAARRYIEDGEAAKVHQAYKCRVRDPWWRVPTVETPHLLLTYMNHDAPRLVRNSAGVRHLNSVHGVRLNEGLRQLGQDILPLAALNSVTMLGAELVGRSYGGGILKVEPKEADLLPVPSPAVLKATADVLRTYRPQLSQALRGADLLRAADLIDGALLRDALHLADDEVEAVRRARAAMFDRRAART